MTFRFEEGLEEHLQNLREQMNDIRAEVHSHCGSPIEKLFADAILTCNTALECRMPVVIRPGMSFRNASAFQIAPQWKIGSYRMDFALMFGSADNALTSRVVVECDGHDFHEKTREQAARDKLRDRYILAHGWPVLRFTGSEIHRDAEACAEEAAGFLFHDWVRLEQLRAQA